MCQRAEFSNGPARFGVEVRKTRRLTQTARRRLDDANKRMMIRSVALLALAITSTHATLRGTKSLNPTPQEITDFVRNRRLKGGYLGDTFTCDSAKFEEWAMDIWNSPDLAPLLLQECIAQTETRTDETCLDENSAEIQGMLNMIPNEADIGCTSSTDCSATPGALCYVHIGGSMCAPTNPNNGGMRAICGEDDGGNGDIGV